MGRVTIHTFGGFPGEYVMLEEYQSLAATTMAFFRDLQRADAEVARLKTVLAAIKVGR